MSHVSIPTTLDLPHTFRRVGWQGRLGTLAAVTGSPPTPDGAVLLVPGFTGSKEDYYSILAPLHERGWAVAAADLPGMADSEGPPGAGAYGLADLAGDVVGMLRNTSIDGGPVHLVGHSVGGLIAREAALLEPSLVASLTLYASGQACVAEPARADAALLASALETLTPAEVNSAMESLNAAAGKPAPPTEVLHFLRRRWALTSPGHLMALAEIARSAPDRVDSLGHLVRSGDLRVLVLFGESDQTWASSDFHRLAERLGVAPVVIEGAAHSPAVENPAAMVDALDGFWRTSP